MKRQFIKIGRFFCVLLLLILVGCIPTYPYETWITGIEVTQVIQDLDNSVLLVAGKRTFARVYANHSSSWNTPNISAQIEGFRNGVSLGLLPIVTGTGSSRQNLDSLYFELPESWIQEGQITLEATIYPTYDGDASDNAITSGVLNFQAGKALRVHLVRYSYLKNGVRISPSQFDIDLIVSQLRRMYPIPMLNFTQTIILQNCAGDSDVISTPCLDSYPSNKNKEPFGYEVRAMLVGLRQTYEQRYDPSAPPLYYGLYAHTPSVAEHPRGQAWPVKWLGDNTAVGWVEAGRNILADSDNNPGFVAAHEIGHLLWRDHVVCGGDEQIIATPDTYPYKDNKGSIGGPASDIYRFAGFDSGDPGLDPRLILRVIPSDYADIMSYCDKRWISDYNYKFMFDFIQTHPEVSGLKSASHFGAISQEIAYISMPNDQVSDYVSIYGTIDTSEQVASLSFLARQTNVSQIPPIEPGAYHILLLDEQDKRLADYAFTPLAGSAGDTKFAIGQIVPFVLGTRRITIYSDVAGREIDSVNISENSPTVNNLMIEGGLKIPANGEVSLSWIGNDADEDRLTYTLLYSFDGGQSWRVLATGITGNRFSIDSSQLEGTETGYFRLIANDGINTGFADSRQFSVDGKPPEVRISTPVNGYTAVHGQLVTMEGYGQDIEDRTLDDSHLSWSSDKDGLLGAGHLLHPSSLSVGTHTITLTVSDSSGQSTTATVVITITQQ